MSGAGQPRGRNYVDVPYFGPRNARARSMRSLRCRRLSHAKSRTRTATQKVTTKMTRHTPPAVLNEIADRMAVDVQIGFTEYLCRQDGFAPYQLLPCPRRAYVEPSAPLHLPNPVKGSGRRGRAVRETALNDVTG
jgi:hypothetical protein